MNDATKALLPILSEVLKDESAIADFMVELSGQTMQHSTFATKDDTTSIKVPVNLPNVALQHIDSLALPPGVTREDMVGEVISLLLRYGISHVIELRMKFRIMGRIAGVLSSMVDEKEEDESKEENGGTIQ